MYPGRFVNISFTNYPDYNNTLSQKKSLCYFANFLTISTLKVSSPPQTILDIQTGQPRPPCLSIVYLPDMSFSSPRLLPSHPASLAYVQTNRILLQEQERTARCLVATLLSPSYSRANQ